MPETNTTERPGWTYSPSTIDVVRWLFPYLLLASVALSTGWVWGASDADPPPSVTISTIEPVKVCASSDRS